MLIYAGKRVGAALLTYLIESGEPNLRVIAGSENDTAILDLSKAAGIPCEIYYKGIGTKFAETGPDDNWLINLWTSHIIPTALLNRFEKCLNLHPSFLPHARGSDSTAWILRKQLPAGVSVIEMTEKLDAGGIYAQKAVDFPFPMRGAELHQLLQDETIALFKEAWPGIRAGTIMPVPQPEGGSYHLRKETNADRVWPADKLVTLEETIRWMLAHDFAPGTTAETVIDGICYRLRLDIEKKI